MLFFFLSYLYSFFPLFPAPPTHFLSNFSFYSPFFIFLSYCYFLCFLGYDFFSRLSTFFSYLILLFFSFPVFLFVILCLIHMEIVDGELVHTQKTLQGPPIWAVAVSSSTYSIVLLPHQHTFSMSSFLLSVSCLSLVSFFLVFLYWSFFFNFFSCLFLFSPSSCFFFYFASFN